MRGAATQVASGLLGVTLVVSPQLLGGVFGWGTSIIATLAGASCLAAAWAVRAEGQSALRTGTLGWVALAVLAWTALQAAPLPRGAVALLQPEALDMWDAAARLLGSDPPAWLPLSLSPHGTRAEVVRGAAMVAAFLASWLLVGLGKRRLGLVLVASSTLAMALVALGHLAAGADTVFGLYRQVHTASALPAPLLNQNHLSGFLAMGAPLFVGLGLDTQDKGQRLAWLTGAAVVGATALLAISRGGAASLVCGLLMLGLLGLTRHRKPGRARVATPLILIAATAAAAAGLGLYVASEALFRDFEAGDVSKIQLAGEGLGLALDHPFVGVGRGAFSAAFVWQHGQDVRFTHPENLLAQWTSEWGLVVGVGLMAVILGSIVRAVRGAHTWTHLGALAGVASIAIHELVDFATELSGVAVVVAALAGCALAPSRRKERHQATEDESSSGFRPWAIASFVGATALVSVAAFGWRLDANSVYALQRELEEQMQHARRHPFAATLRRAVRLHPAEPSFFLLAGAEAVRHGDPSALAWLNRAMNLARGWSAPHQETARYLARAGRPRQAFLELRQAEERRTGSAVATACAILQTQPDLVEEFVRTAGDDALGTALLDGVAGCLPLEATAAAAIDEQLWSRDVVAARVRVAQRALASGEPTEALAVLAPLAEVREDAVRLTRARALLAAGRSLEAIRALDGAESWSQRPESILRLRAEAEAAARREDAMRSTLEELRGYAAGRTSLLASAWIVQGRLERQLGNNGRAMQAFERADRIDPASGGLTHVARLSEELGDYARSFRAFADLCRTSGPSSPHCAARDRVRARMSEPPRLAGQRTGMP